MQKLENNNVDIAIEEAILVIKEAANEILVPAFHRRDEIKKSSKGSINGLVTEADINCSNFILERLRIKYPGSYSEEDMDNSRLEHDLIWQIDPIDGTQEFVSGMVDGFAINAALLSRQSDKIWMPIAGIVHAPMSGKTLFSDSSGVIHLCTPAGDRIINFSEPQQSPQLLLGYVRKVAPDKNAERFYLELGEELGLAVDIIYGGGSGASFIDLFEQRINLAVVTFDYSYEWDISAVAPLIKSAKGFLVDIFGESFQFNRNDLRNSYGYIVSIDFNATDILYRGKNTLKVNALR
jgi:fructose-1,6-bisphosphatase/inositol monophosphatase family enzyme